MTDKGQNASTTGANLDITQLPDKDQDGLANRIETFYKNDNTVKSRLSYNWDRNHKFLDGEQWIVYDGERETGGIWKRLTVSKTNEYIPRPVTNFIFDGYQTLKSYLIKNKPRSTVVPNTRTHRDKSAAKIAELVLECNWERLLEQNNYEYAAACLLTYGTVFKKDYWDTSNLNMVKIPKMQQMPKMDPQTGQIIGMEQVPMIDPQTGQEVFESLPLGDVNTDIVEPYRIAIDPSANDLHKIKWIMEYSIQPLDWIIETYDKQEEFFTGKAKDVKEETSLSGSMRRFHQLKNSSGIKNTGASEAASGSNGDVNISNQAVVKEYYERPSIKHPQGRMVVVANGKALYIGPSPYAGPDLGDWHPYSECRWEIVPGRFWGKSPLDAGVEIQKQINSIDSCIILARKTMAIPQRLIPMGAGITNGVWTGRPGQEIHYRDSGGNKPEIIPSAGVDGTVFQERQQRCEDLKNVMGAIDILKGDRPPGVTAASALNLLYEVGTGKLFPVLDRWKKFVEMSQKKQLKLVAKRFQEPREAFIQMLKAKNTELPSQAINNFIGSDLYDNCNVLVEAGSNIPKLMAAKQAGLQEAAQAGVLNLQNPANSMEYQRQMGIVGFDNDVGPDTERAEWENSLLDNIKLSPDNQPIVLEVDNDAIHMEVLARRMKEPAWMEEPQEVQQAYIQHYTAHMDSDSKKKQAAMMEAMTTGQPPQAPHDQSAMQPHAIGPSGKGPTKETRNALKSDVLVPGSLP